MDSTTRKKNKKWLYPVIGFGLPALLLILTTHFDFSGRFEGIFLLKGKPGSLLEVRDDLYLGEGSRLINGIAIDKAETRYFKWFGDKTPGEAYLYYEWDEKEGAGYVRNFLSDGREIQTCFSRFLSQGGGHDHGLFVGGGLPSDVDDNEQGELNNTGMSFYDGKRWRHVWCTMNESLASGAGFGKVIPPFEWKYLGSKVLGASRKELALMSRHEVNVDGEPVQIDRYAYFRAGEPYFILAVNLTNNGKRPVRYIYCYGDEPWVGNYGSSRGNVGWVKDRLVEYTQWIDTDKYSYAGYFDYGNRVAGEGRDFTRTANFIEWLGENRPNAFFSNGPGDFPKEQGENEPLMSNTRFIGLEWGPDMLQPGESNEYAVAMGMANNDAVSGFPVKPDIKLSYMP